VRACFSLGKGNCLVVNPYCCIWKVVRGTNWLPWPTYFVPFLSNSPNCSDCRLPLKCDGTHAESGFRLSAKRTSPFKSAGSRQFSRLLAAEVCASAVVMLDTPCSEVVWRVLATHSIRQFPILFPSRASQCAIRFQLDSTWETPAFSLCARRCHSVRLNDWTSFKNKSYTFILQYVFFITLRVVVSKWNYICPCWQAPYSSLQLDLGMWLSYTC